MKCTVLCSKSVVSGHSSKMYECGMAVRQNPYLYLLTGTLFM